MKKVGMVLEGGGMRGIFTVGVLDYRLENNIEIDGIIGVSAGALFGVNYFSKQKGRALNYNKKYLGDKRYISKRSLLLTGNLINKDFAYYKITKDLVPFDNQTFIKNNKDYYVTTTDIETGKPTYFKITDVYKQLEEFRASSAIPFASKIIKINNKKYLDGGISDSIPLDKCLDLGYQKIIVILTQPINYQKQPLNKKQLHFIKLKYYKYPNLINTMKNRYIKYNNTLEKIIDLENKKEIFVIRPPKKINIPITSRNIDKIQEVYDMGIKECQKNINILKEYLTKK